MTIQTNTGYKIFQLNGSYDTKQCDTIKVKLQTVFGNYLVRWYFSIMASTTLSKLAPSDSTANSMGLRASRLDRAFVLDGCTLAAETGLVFLLPTACHSPSIRAAEEVSVPLAAARTYEGHGKQEPNSYRNLFNNLPI